MFGNIITEEDYREALKRFLEICETQKPGDEENEFFVLMDLLEKYERENCSGA
jgi:hypothetical protein